MPAIIIFSNIKHLHTALDWIPIVVKSTIVNLTQPIDISKLELVNAQTPFTKYHYTLR